MLKKYDKIIIIGDTMKSEKGFTLVELVAIIALLAVVFLVSFPQLQSTMQKDKEKQYNDFIATLCESAKEYIYATEKYEVYINTTLTVKIEIKELIDFNIIDDTITNPRTNKKVNTDALNVKFEADGNISCVLVE